MAVAQVETLEILRRLVMKQALDDNSMRISLAEIVSLLWFRSLTRRIVKIEKDREDHT